ncbi:MAG: hypothetical protein ACHQ17_07225 [Polyangia bacterium]
MKRILIALGALVLAGCAGDYAYVPAEAATAQVGGQAAADYPIPPEAPQGDVRIASFGISPLAVNQQESVRALHLRMVIANNSSQQWTVDTREQLAALSGEGESRPIFASTDQGELPLVPIAPGDKRTIDLFYPLPADLQKASELPEFDLVWNVDTGNGRVVAERTPFQRVTVEPQYAADYSGYYEPAYWGPIWWYDPYYFQYTFARPVIIHRRPVIVGRPLPRHHRGFPAPVVVGPPARAPVHTHRFGRAPPAVRANRPPTSVGRPPVQVTRPPVQMTRPPVQMNHAPVSRPPTVNRPMIQMSRPPAMMGHPAAPPPHR